MKNTKNTTNVTRPKPNSYSDIKSYKLSLSLHFNGHFPGEPGLAGVY